MKKNLEAFIEEIDSLDNDSLLTIRTRCEELYNARREKLRPVLMENLQKAIKDILDNDFALSIKNPLFPIHEDGYEIHLGPKSFSKLKITIK